MYIWKFCDCLQFFHNASFFLCSSCNFLSSYTIECTPSIQGLFLRRFCFYFIQIGFCIKPNKKREEKLYDNDARTIIYKFIVGKNNVSSRRWLLYIKYISINANEIDWLCMEVINQNLLKRSFFFLVTNTQKK